MKKFFKETKAGRFLAGFGEGFVQCFPAGNGLLRAIEKMRAKPEDQKKLPDWTAIVFEFIGIGVVIYAFKTKMITTDELINYLTVLIEAISK